MIMKDDWSKSLSRPNSIWLGRYRGDPLFWTELSRDDGKILFLCRNIIEYLPFHDKYEAVAWDNCTLRTWLNGEFYSTAFSSSDRQLIRKATLKTKNSQDTEDYVWLLSANEARSYFPDNGSDRIKEIVLDGPCRTLEPRHIGQGIGIRQSDVWLLRSNAGYEGNKYEVSNVIDYNYTIHEVNDEGRNLNVNSIAGIRPCILVDSVKELRYV